MGILLISIGLILAIVGLIGCIIPGLPGVPLNFISLLLIQYAFKPFSATFMWWMAGIAIVITVLDYLIPVWGAKFAGASRLGVIGSMVGLIAGMFLTPIGMVLGAFLGAIIGELLSGKDNFQSIKAGLGTVIGLLLGTVMKLVVSLVMTFYFLVNVGEYIYIMYLT
jgi:uncharacterized protein